VNKQEAELMKEMLGTAILMHTLANIETPRAQAASELGELIFDMILDILKDADKELKRLEKENVKLKAIVKAL